MQRSAVAAIVAIAAFVATQQSTAPGPRMQDNGIARAPGQQMQEKGSVPGSPGASG
jgi:hypothetical protein